MMIGVHVVNVRPWATAESIVSLGTRAEALGFDSLWVSDQVVIPSELESSFSYSVTGQYDIETNQNFFEALSVLTFLAGRAPAECIWGRAFWCCHIANRWWWQNNGQLSTHCSEVPRTGSLYFPLRPNERHTLCVNVFHFRYGRGIYRYALQIRFAPLSRGAPEDMNLNAGLHRVALTDLVCAGKNYRFQYTFGLRRA